MLFLGFWWCLINLLYNAIYSLIFVYMCLFAEFWWFLIILLMVVADCWYGCPSHLFAPINYIPQIATNRAEQADRQILWRWPAASNTVGTWYQCVPRVPFLGGCPCKMPFFLILFYVIFGGETIEFTGLTPAVIFTTSRNLARFQATATGWPLILPLESVSRYIHIPELQHDGHFGVSDGDRGALKIEKKTNVAAATRVQYSLMNGDL